MKTLMCFKTQLANTIDIDSICMYHLDYRCMAWLLLQHSFGRGCAGSLDYC